ncbi:MULTISPECIES: polyprenyl synthetase family protein [Nitrosomonas]|uniref:Farnesyl-diphosphate synthase n=2 Tax=Nitrosomonas eutropha TaxID=916 RepID=A0ABX5M852_9PROT|nr:MULTISPECIES: farnesyl diphosphate synthase [Nitrosomonas]ABI59745.1 farnesyl-diphosphate synthase [Nitrosomonas eutropha C91]MXS80244.1 polyprenyl synthetase family protein [Nitrosomonas sp. GH22]PXV82453.1 farnesyl-diphosphate synthase [Nitrosomonas eutropha]SCX00670.1 farnesyl-diphosphate synthase [Nitrosomonas eutropha]SDW33464.1 farnesyl-diphosphate synthase [Nitrosomonas eutropha]
MHPDFQLWTTERLALIESFLEQNLPATNCAPARLHEAMRYAVLNGGKRVRPLLSFAAGELSGADKTQVIAASAAVELIHAYSLVHDDLPCMDNDILRRGKPTCHIRYGEPTALLVGDSLQSLAFQLLAESALTEDPRTQLEMIRHLAFAAGSRGMAGGQAIDLDSVGKTLSLPELEFMHIHKTGALIRAAVILGARCGSRLNEDQFKQLDHFAKCIGLAFQVVDDILDAEASTAALGKTAGKDAENNKPTYVSILGIKQARELAHELQREASGVLDKFGPEALRLQQITDFIVQREF